jgi:hypothetical protein
MEYSPERSNSMVEIYSHCGSGVCSGAFPLRLIPEVRYGGGISSHPIKTEMSDCPAWYLVDSLRVALC